jgi:hypothetical protein
VLLYLCRCMCSDFSDFRDGVDRQLLSGKDASRCSVLVDPAAISGKEK